MCFYILYVVYLCIFFQTKKDDSLKLSPFYLSPFLYGLPRAAGALELLTKRTNTTSVTIYGIIDNKFSFILNGNSGFPKYTDNAVENPNNKHATIDH